MSVLRVTDPTFGNSEERDLASSLREEEFMEDGAW